jgi:hypothetical protein
MSFYERYLALEKARTWESHVEEALHSVQNGQHLRFIGYHYLTIGVCVAALEYETNHNSHPHDIGSVPVAIIDEVVAIIKDKRRTSSSFERLSKYLDKIVKERKEAEQAPGYYGEFANHQARLDHYGVKTFDEMLKAMYNKAAVE